MTTQKAGGRYTLALAIGALGVVYGDIGTSPLYALRECFHGPHAIEVTRGNVFGVLSLVFWSLILIVSIKYLAFILRADNKGEGGILALLTLAFPERNPSQTNRLTKLIIELIERAELAKMKLAPFLGIACPGLIDDDGKIVSGGQNLPGNWESDDFHLPSSLKLPKIGNHEPVLVMHNDAVVQGLSAVPAMKAVKHWGVLTIGTGLGNARFTNHDRES